MHVEVIQSQKHYDNARVICVGIWVPGSVCMNRRNSLLCLSFLLVRTGVCEGGRGMCFEEYEYVSRPLEG